MTSPINTIAFFGATGGCALSSLKLCLQAGTYKCTALARTPQKLTSLLLSYGIPQSAISRNLQIIHGNILDPSAVRSTKPSSTIVDLIISGIGNLPSLTFFYGDFPKICTKGVQTILSTLSALKAEGEGSSNQNQSQTTTITFKKPILVTISSTGVTKKQRDVPVLLLPVYNWVIPRALADKRKMEEILEEEARKSKIGGDDGDVTGGCVVVRPSHLSEGKRLGVGKIRVGVEYLVPRGKGKREDVLTIGYSISKKDVGGWIFEECVVKGATERVGGRWSITY